MGIFAILIHLIFKMDWSTWASPLLWMPFVLMWIGLANGWVNELMKYEVLRHLDRKAEHHNHLHS